MSFNALTHLLANAINLLLVYLNIYMRIFRVFYFLLFPFLSSSSTFESVLFVFLLYPVQYSCFEIGYTNDPTKLEESLKSITERALKYEIKIADYLRTLSPGG